ncbi:MAG: O-antigen ligase family protein [Acidobacteriota bacterium]|nr:O-antigen ligase family protein [Acidobacteriota bacterium]
MQKFLRWLDEIAVTNQESNSAKWLERIAFVFLVLMILSAPHSIAATQTAWLIGMFAWFVRLFIKPRPKLVRTSLDAALWAFFGWSVITSVFSYAPDISLDKLRGVALFLIFYFVINNLRSKRAAVFLAFALIFSCMFNVIWTPIERLVGRGVEIHGVSAESPLTKTIYVENYNQNIVLKDGDALLEVNKKKIRAPEDLLSALEQNETVRLRFYRPDYYLNVQIKRADLLTGATAMEKLGFTDWKKSRNWRSMGFYGHWTTYAEVLQLIASLTFGLFIGFFLTQSRKVAKSQSKIRERFGNFFLPFSLSPFLLFFCLSAMSLALLLNVTRASQLGFLVSAISIVVLTGSRKMLLILAAVILPVALGGLLFLQHSRNVGFFDREDESTKYRQTVYREGFDLWTNNARHFFLGVGMDSIKRYAKDWRLFNDGKLPMGHFHSTPLQLVVERGLPALLLWIWILGVYARTLWRGLRRGEEEKGRKGENTIHNQSKISSSPLPLLSSSWRERGILLGCFGGLVGFFTSGLVHYNLGDAEVAMVFFILMGISVALCDSRFQISNSISKTAE